MISHSVSDNELWAGIKQGDKKSLSLLFGLYSSRLSNYGLKIVPCNDFIKDCIQELFLTIWEQRHSISQVHSVKAYLYVSMRRMVFHNLRKNKNNKNRNLQYAEAFFEHTSDIESWIVTEEKRNEEKNQLNKAKKTLSTRQREILILKYDHGLSNSEIAVLLNIKRQSVYNHVSEAIKELRYFIRTTSHQSSAKQSSVVA